MAEGSDVPTIVQLLNSPLAQVGPLVFDCELSVARGVDVDFTDRRVAAGVNLSDHRRVRPREWELEAAVANAVQFQNIARPGADALAVLQAQALSAALSVPVAGSAAAAALDAAGVVAGRLDAFEDDLTALVLAGDEVDVVTKAPGTRGRFRAVVQSFRAVTTATGPDAGGASTYRLRLREIQRAGELGLAEATLEALGLNGSATVNSLGSTGSPSGVEMLLP